MLRVRPMWIEKTDNTNLLSGMRRYELQSDSPNFVLAIFRMLIFFSLCPFTQMKNCITRVCQEDKLVRRYFSFVSDDIVKKVRKMLEIWFFITTFL